MRPANRRQFLLGASALGLAVGTGGGRVRADTTLVPIKATFGPSSVLDAVNMVALELGFAREQGLDLKLVITDAGAQSRQILAAGEADYAHGDATHPLQLSNRGKPAKMLLATETISTNANIVVRKDLYDQGITSVDKLAAWKRPDGAMPIVAATGIGSSTWMFGTFVFEAIGGGGKVNWVAGGGASTILGGLKSKQFDAIMAVPSWQFEAEDNGWGKVIFDISAPAAWDKAFGGPMPAASIYGLETTLAEKDKTQAYVNAIYRSMQWLKTVSADEVYAKLGQKYLGDQDPKAITREIAYYQKVWNFSGKITEEDFKRAAPVWYREGTGLRETTFAASVDSSFLDAAARKYG